MNNKDLERIGEFLVKVGLIADWEIDDEGEDYAWIRLILIFDTADLQSLDITFNKEHGYIMNIEHSKALDLLEDY